MLRCDGANVLQPEIPECHTMAPVYIVAEHAANFIAEEYGLKC